MFKSWTQTLLGLGIIGIGLLFVLVAGFHVYITSTATPLHPDAQSVPSVAGWSVAPEWTSPVDQARQVARGALIEQNLPGLSVAVGVGDDLVWAEGFGFADLESRDTITPDVRFRIGTASVVLTSAGAGLLLEKRLLSLDDEIQMHVPEFPQKDAPVTIRHLMAHTAGVRNDSGDEGPLYTQHCDRPVEALEVFAGRSLLFEPGTRFRYSSYGWILVSAAIEAAAGQPFHTFMQEQVFKPLGMADTLADSATASIAGRATPYFPRYGGDPKYGLHGMRPIDLSCYAGASVFLSTPSDLVRFALAINNGRLLKPETVQMLQTPQRLSSGEETGYGLGWDIETVTLDGRQTRAPGHDGVVLGGSVASLLTFPDRGLAVAVTSNIAYADTHAIGLRIAEVFASAQPGQ